MSSIGRRAARRRCMRSMSVEFDVMVLDVMLPELDGFDIVRRMRARGNRTPVLMLTARDADADVVSGLNAGADDYLTKPFSFDVLLARIHALARRGPSIQAVPLQVADLTLDASTHTVSRGGVTCRSHVPSSACSSI